ncbi:MAG: alpha/beta fold hydrolase [Actinomycetota bacterium]
MIERARSVVSGGVRLAVRDHGGDGPPLLCIHGLASSSHIFDLVTPLVAGEFHVVSYDQRGHGESAKPSSGYGFERTAADAAAVVRALRLRGPIVLGHSWGANVALELAVRHPIAVGALVLLDGGFLSMRERMDWRTTKATLAPPPIAGLHIDEYLGMLRQFMGGSLDVTPEVEAVFRSLMRVDGEGRIRPRLSRGNHLKILRALWAQDPPALLRMVRVPTAVVATRRSDAAETDAMFIAAKELGERPVREIGDPVRFEWMEGIHDVPLQRPEAVADLVRRVAKELP